VPIYLCESSCNSLGLFNDPQMMTLTFVPPRTVIHGGGSVAAAAVKPVSIGADVELRDADEDLDMDMDVDMDMEGVDEHDGAGSLLAKKLVVPGQLVTDDPQFMRYVQLRTVVFSGKSIDKQGTRDIYW
jgi:hypothetical protein